MKIRREFEWIAFLVISTIGFLVTSCSTNKPEIPASYVSKKQQTLRIATYNVFTGAHDSDQTTQAIRRMRADVVLLQELSPRGAEMLDDKLKKDFPYRKFSGGLAILSRYPIRRERYERSRHGINGFLVGEIRFPGGNFQVASLHLDPLHMWTRREKWSIPYQLVWGQDAIHRKEVGQVGDMLKPGMPTILGGDFNTVSRAPIRELEEAGYTDSFASVNKRPDQTHTLRFKLFGIKTGRRIDYLLHDPSFETLHSEVVAGVPSDHDAVVSVFKWK